MKPQVSTQRVLQRIYPYVFTISVISAATIVKIGMQKWWGLTSPLPLYYSAVIASAWFGGRRQGFLATILALLVSEHFFVEPGKVFPLPPLQYWGRYILFIIDSTVVTLLCAALRDATRRSEAALGEAQNAQDTLIEANLRFRRVFESNMIGLLFIHSDGTLIEANDYLLKMLGLKREALESGQINYRSLVPPEPKERIEQRLQQLNEIGALAPFEQEFLRTDGGTIPTLLGAAKVSDEMVVACVLDVSENRRTQEMRATAERLEQSQKFLDSVIENIPNMLFVKDAKDLRFVRLNRAGESLIGLSRDQILGKSDYDFLPATEAHDSQAKERTILATHQSVEVADEPLSTRFGLRHLHTKKIPIYDQDGQPKYLLGISEDITEKKEAEQQRLRLLQEQAARVEAEKTADQLRFLAEASAALNETLDMKAMLESFAKCVINNFSDWCEIVLLSEGELRIADVIVAHRDPLKVKWAQQFRETQAIDWEQLTGVASVIRSGQPTLMSRIDEEFVEKLNLNKERREAISRFAVCSAIIVPLLSYGRVMGTLSITAAESKRNYSELDLSLVQDLARRVSFAIENSRLFKKAQEASHAKSAFLANMSHEIRTPLGAMLGFAELLAGEPLNVEQKNYISILLRNGQQLLRIVDEILDLSKVESQKIQLESVQFSLGNLVEEAMSLLRHRAAEKNLAFHVTSPTELAQDIISDPSRLRQILLNVTGNAIKFTQKGSICVHFELHPRSAHPDRPMLEVSVTDTGIGIAREQQDKLFQPFVQADNSMTRRFGGTGLGLFLSRRLARMMGGDVVLRSSQPEVGSQFIVTLEVQSAASEDTSKSVVKLEPLGEKSATRQQGRVLIVDDAPDNRTLIQLYVSRLGFPADVACTGPEAIELALSHPYELILMDVQMPEMDGFESVHELRARNYKGPIVALTAHTMKGDRDRCLRGGFDDYLGKPIDRNLLKQSLCKFLGPQPTLKLS
jgi:PAS domain S-box-containing protein